MHAVSPQDSTGVVGSLAFPAFRRIDGDRIIDRPRVPDSSRTRPTLDAPRDSDGAMLPNDASLAEVGGAFGHLLGGGLPGRPSFGFLGFRARAQTHGGVTDEVCCVPARRTKTRRPPPW